MELLLVHICKRLQEFCRVLLSKILVALDVPATIAYHAKKEEQKQVVQAVAELKDASAYYASLFSQYDIPTRESIENALIQLTKCLAMFGETVSTSLSPMMRLKAIILGIYKIGKYCFEQLVLPELSIIHETRQVYEQYVIFNSIFPLEHSWVIFESLYAV